MNCIFYARNNKYGRGQSQHTCFPNEKGITASFISFVGFAQRDGINESGSLNIFTSRKLSANKIIQTDPFVIVSSRLVLKSCPTVLAERPTGCKRIPSFTAHFNCSQLLQFSGGKVDSESRNLICSCLFLASSIKVNAMLLCTCSILWQITKKWVSNAPQKRNEY